MDRGRGPWPLAVAVREAGVKRRVQLIQDKGLFSLSTPQQTWTLWCISVPLIEREKGLTLMPQLCPKIAEMALSITFYRVG